jgi:hypothetical protein
VTASWSRTRPPPPPTASTSWPSAAGRAPRTPPPHHGHPGLFTFVEEGTANSDSGFILTTDGPITLGTTGLNFTQFTGAGQITAGAGLTKTGNIIDAVGTTDRITVRRQHRHRLDLRRPGNDHHPGHHHHRHLAGTTIALNKGGTGATTAAAARTNLGAVGKFAVANGGTTTDTVVHNLATTDVIVSVKDTSSLQLVEADIYVTDANTVTVMYATPPAPAPCASRSSGDR